jgi:hypothetical protein
VVVVRLNPCRWIQFVLGGLNSPVLAIQSLSLGARGSQSGLIHAGVGDVGSGGGVRINSVSGVLRKEGWEKTGNDKCRFLFS